jgi:glycosyltransferase involved in cell wall biosynthesis
MQTYQDINVIIIDDCSNELYNDLLNKYKNILNINYIKLLENHGSGYARKIGLENSNGDYIVFADSDDTFLNAFSIEKMVQSIKSGNYDFASFGFAQECEDLQFSSIQCNATWIFSKIYSKKFLD